MRLQRCFFVPIFLLLVINLWGQQGNSFFRTISIENGLRSNTVRTVAQDNRGFIWMGTDEGLCRYDGNEVVFYRNPHTGIDQFVSAIQCTKDGLLVGTGHGAFFFSFHRETFTRYLPQVKAEVRKFCFDKDGNVWIATMGQGVFRYNPSKGRVKQFALRPLHGKVYSLCVDASNQIWALSRDGYPSVCRLNKAKDQFQDVGSSFSVKITDAVDMLQTREGTLLLGTWDHGLYVVNTLGKVSQVFSPVKAGVGRHLHTMTEMRQGDIYMGTDDGVVVYNLQTKQWRQEFVHDNKSVPGNQFVYSLIRDFEGGIWLGTFYGGVKYYSPMRQRFKHFGNGENGFTSFVVSHFCEDNSGRVWIGSDDGGLSCFSMALGRIVPYPAQQELAHYNVHALCVKDDDLWLGTYSNGIVRMNLTTGVTRKYGTHDGLTSNSCYALFNDPKGRLWAATMDGTVWLYQVAGDRFVPIRNMGDLIIDIDVDHKGNLWFTTQEKGLFRFSAGGHHWKHYIGQDRLPGNGWNCLEVADDGSVWVGTGIGLCRYNAKKDRFDRVGLPQDYQDVNGIVSDQGVLWLATSRGIVRFQPGKTPWMFNRFDGLISAPFRPNACLKASDGRIFFGGQNGFTVFAPYQIALNQKQPPVFITRWDIYNRTQEVGSDRLPESLAHISRLDLYHGDRMFTLSFAALSYCSPEKNRYAYMLEGFDKEWNYVGNRHTATYTNLPAGKYVFRVKATNNDGVWSKKEAQLIIRVHPPVWLSWPAIVFYVLIVLAAVYGYTQIRLRKAEKRHREEMRRMNDRKEMEIKEARLKFFTTIAHEIRTPLTLIIGPLEQLMSGTGKADKDRGNGHQSALSLIDKNAHRLLDLVNQLLDFNKVQQSGMALHFRLVNITELVQSVAERFRSYLSQQHIDLEVCYPSDSFSAMIDLEAVTKVVSNLMTNAMKYTRDHIVLRVEKDADGKNFRISVADNGIGISEEERKHIFEAFYQAKDNKPGTGIGLSIVKTIVAKHNGSVSVDSEVGKGSVFTVTLPVSQEGVEIDSVEDRKESEGTDTVLSPAESFARQGTGTKEPVLIVEDDEDLCQFLATNFSGCYEVFTAHDGREGLEVLRNHSVALIVSDWMMPEMDGKTFCEHVRGNVSTSHIPFIMLTAKTDNQSKTEGMECGADAYIEKPFSMEYLNACIANLIKMRQLLMKKFAASPKEPITEMARTAVDNDLLTQMNRIIEENLNNPDLSVNFLAAKMNISRSGLFAKLKALTDTTPNEMIQVVRLRKAASLLATERYHVNEVSFMVGFNSPSYFSKCFQKQFGVKPADYTGSE